MAGALAIRGMADGALTARAPWLRRAGDYSAGVRGAPGAAGVRADGPRPTAARGMARAMSRATARAAARARSVNRELDRDGEPGRRRLAVIERRRETHPLRALERRAIE